MNEKKRTVGRPIAGAAPKNKMESFKCTAEESEKIKLAAEIFGSDKSEFMRVCVMKRANKLLRE